MAAAQLLQQLQCDDDLLQRTLRTGTDDSNGVANAQATLEHMKQTISELRKVQSTIPSESARINRQCEDFERRHRAHLKVLQAREGEAMRAQLWQGRSGKDMSTLEEDNARVELQELQRGHETMHRTLHQMQHITGALDDTSKGIRKTKDQYETYSEKLRSASQVLGHLKRKTEEDSRLIWWSFFYFIAVVSYIVLRRLKVFKMIFVGVSWTWWSGSTVVTSVHGILMQLVRAYQAFCELLGIPSAFDENVDGATIG